LRPRREKVFGLARGFPDRNARVRIEAFVLAWNAKHKQERPITAAHQRVLHALLWRFMNYRDGLCFPSYETIAEKARCEGKSGGGVIHRLTLTCPREASPFKRHESIHPTPIIWKVG
jgi:broad specificity phosphatase PhoE